MCLHIYKYAGGCACRFCDVSVGGVGQEGEGRLGVGCKQQCAGKGLTARPGEESPDL